MKSLSFVISVNIHIGFEDRGLLLVVPLRVHCLYSSFRSPESKALCELKGWDSSRRLWVCLFTLSDINISETSLSIIIKLHLKHHSSRGLAVLGFGSDRVRTLVFMTTDSSHRVIMGKIL